MVARLDSSRLHVSTRAGTAQPSRVLSQGTLPVTACIASQDCLVHHACGDRSCIHRQCFTWSCAPHYLTGAVSQCCKFTEVFGNGFTPVCELIRQSCTGTRCEVRWSLAHFGRSPWSGLSTDRDLALVANPWRRTSVACEALSTAWISETARPDFRLAF